MQKVYARLAPKILKNEQNETRVRICMEWLENWDVFDRVITDSDGKSIDTLVSIFILVPIIARSFSKN